MDRFFTYQSDKNGGDAASPGPRPGWEAIHEEACRRGEHFYADPDTGLRVGTRVRLLARGQCCGNGCRHCPYAATNGA